MKIYGHTFQQVAHEVRSSEPDSIIYINVLEHISDDQAELNVINDVLDTGGRVFIFVPALRCLHGSFDRQIHHHRRYSRGDLEKKCRTARFEIIESRYFDLAGVLPWWIKYRLLKSNKMEPAAVRFYDQVIVPIARTLESRIRPPLGKNILLVAEKR